jgi:hypothetical protein
LASFFSVPFGFDRQLAITHDDVDVYDRIDAGDFRANHVVAILHSGLKPHELGVDDQRTISPHREIGEQFRKVGQPSRLTPRNEVAHDVPRSVGLASDLPD